MVAQNTAAVSVSSAPVAADQRWNDGRQAIIVTARLWAERLQRVPQSSTAFPHDDLTANGIGDFEGVPLRTPCVVLNKQSDDFNNLIACGVATNANGTTPQSRVVVYVDELAIWTIGETTTLNPKLYDVERVEFP